jgi:histidine ammonia-lyase
MLQLDGESLTLEQLELIAGGALDVRLADSAARRVAASRAVVDAKASGDVPVYGVNTGFGALAETAIPRDQLGTTG